MTETKACSKCRVVLPVDAYTRRPEGALGRVSACTPCRTKASTAYYRAKRALNPKPTRAKPRTPATRFASHIKMTYGLSVEEWAAMYNAQDRRCKVCKAFLGLDKPGRGGPAVDHCHKTGRIRGILCFPCNSAIGHARDCPKILAAMIAYVQEHSNGG